MGDNISKFYNAFSAKYNNLGSEDEFRNYLKNAKRENIDKLYNAFNSKYNNFGSADEMISYLGWSDGSAQQEAAAAAPVTTDAPAPAGTPESRERMGAAEGRAMFDQRRNAMRPSTSALPVTEPAPQHEPEPQEQGNPFPYRKEDSFEEELNNQLKDLKEQKREVDNARVGDDQLIEEYERRLKENVRSLDPTSKRHRENEQWLREHKDAYTEARDSDRKKESDRLKGEISKIENAQAAAENEAARKANRELMASPSEVVARGLSPFGRDNSGREDKEHAYRAAADELYAQAEQEHRKPNKYDENAGSFVDQFAEGAGNNIDRGSLTMGLSEGAASVAAREIGDHYDKVVGSVLDDMGISDADITADMVTMETSGKRLEELNAEAERMGSELDAMKSTYEDMVRRGDPGADAYGRRLNKKIDEYNRWLEKDYDPVRKSYDYAKGRYDKVMGAIDDRVSGELSDGEMTVLDALEKLTKAKMLRSDDVSIAAKAGAGAEQSAEFMLDFYLTGGLGKAGTKAATKLTTKHLLRKFGKDTVKEMAAKGSINPSMWSRIVTDAGVAAARTSLMATRNLQAYGDNLTEYVGRDAAGRFNFDRSHLNAALNTALSQYIEYWSEGFGEYFGSAEQALFKNVTKSAPMATIGKTLKGYRGSIGQYLDKGKFDGMFNEMMEEVVGSAFNSLAGWMSNDRVGDEDALKDFFSGENIATLALSFLPMSTISAATNVGAYHDMKKRYDKGVAGLKPFIESGAISQEELKHLSLNLSEMTPKEIVAKIVDINDRARKANGGKLPSDFAQNIMGYLEGDFAMSLRNDEWENSQEKLAVVNAYTSNYANPKASNAWDYDQNLQAATQAAVAAGFTEDELEKDSYMIGQDAMQLRIDDAGLADVLMDYATAKAAVDGLQQGYAEQTRQVNDARAAAVRERLDVNGNVIAATLGGNRVFVTTKDVTVNPDGTISTPTGDGLVAYRTNEEEKEPKTAKAGEFTDAVAQSTDSYVQDVNDVYDRQRAAVYKQAKNTVSPMGQMRALSQVVGRQVVVTDHNGVYAPVSVERMTSGGQKVVIRGDKKQMQGIAAAMGVQVPAGQYLEAEVSRLYPLLDKQEDGSLTVFQDTEEQQKQMEEAEKAAMESGNGTQLPEVKPDTWHTIDVNGRPTDVRVFSVNDDGVTFEYKDENGEDVDGRMSLYEFQNAVQMAQEPAPAEAPAAAQEEVVPERGTFPVNEETGEKIYDHPSVTPEAAFSEIMADAKPGSKNEANRLKAIDRARAAAHQDLNIAEASIAKAQREKSQVDEWELPDDESLDAFEQRKARARADADARIAELERQIPELQRRADHWDAVGDMASAVSSARKALEREARLVSRAENWSSKTGVNVRIFRSPEEVDDKGAKAAIERGELVGGWYNPKTGEVGLYLPNLSDETEVDKTFIHEVVSHKGLRDLLGEENYDALCDKVWDQLMSEEKRQEYLAYNSHLKGDEQFLRRAAADEWIANFSEGLGLESNKNIFDKFVEFVKEFLDRILGEDSKITKEDIESLLRSSLANYETRRNEMREAELSNSGIAANGEDTRFSVRYVPSQDEVAHIAKDISSTMDIPEEQARKWLESEMSLAAIITGYQEFLNYKADDRYTAIKNDSDYPQGTVDFNNICRKRLDFTEMYQRIQRAYPNTIITGEDLATIRNIMKKHGLTVACGLCYVEDRRQLLGEIAKDFIDNVAGDFKRYESKGGETKKKNAEKFRSLIGDDRKEDLSIYDLITLDGSTKLNQEHPGIYKAFQAFNSARGQQAGNLFQGYAEYKHEILNWSDAKVQRVNDNGGLRIFSYSDFEAHHLIDIVQIIIDCARKGVKIQGYTKVPAFARAVANTGIKLNRSLIPLGDTGIVDGKLAYDPIEGIDINDPDFLESNDNVGNVLIGINDEQIRLAMADPFVHYIIPYHSNQSGVLRGMKQTGKWTNYKNEQTDKGENVGKHGVNIYTDVLNAAEAEGKPITNEREFTERFLAVCKEKGWTPRFARFLDTNEAGDYVYTPGYYKLLLDFKLFDENGNILPQTPVVAEFDDEFNAKILMDYVAEQQERKTRDLDPVYDEIVEALDLDGRDIESVDDGGTRFRKVTNPGMIKRLEKGPKVKVYRSMQFVPDPNGDVEYDLGDGNGMQKGFLYAPMSAKVDGKWREPIQLNRWEEAEENPDMADENGDFILDKGDGSDPMKVAYAPYLHTRRSPLNDQFSSAYKRPNLVIVESEVPESELTSGYTADKSKKSTGEHDWSSGKVSNALAKRGLDTRKVILSRWAKPVRIVPNSEVADQIVDLMGNRKLSFPYNVVTPSLRAELSKRGVKFAGWQGNKPKDVDELIARMQEENESAVRFRKSVDATDAAADLYDRYENQDGADNPWMSEGELIEKIEEEIPYGIETKELFSKIDEYKRLDQEDFDEGRRDYSGGDKEEVFDEILSDLEKLGNRNRKPTEFEQKEERVAAAEKEYTDKTIDSMTPVIGAGVRRISRNDMPKGHESDKGYYDPATNNVSVCMDNVADERDAIATVLHETVGYKGLKELFGEQYRDTMARVYGALDNAGRTWVNGYIKANDLQLGDGAIVRAMAEYMARTAERDGGSALQDVNEVLGGVIDDLFGTDGFRFTDRELAYMLRASYEHMLNPAWLSTPVGRSKDALMKRELGINETDPNKPTDPEGPGAGIRYRRGDTGRANADYNREVERKMTALITENQNADLPVKIGIEKVMKEVGMEKLAEDEDYLTRHNLSSSRAETENHDFELFHFNPLKEQVKAIQEKLLGGRRGRSGLDETYDRILDYLYAVSGLERNEWKRNETGEQRDFSGITSLMGRPKEEWQEAEADARAMIDAFENEVGKDMTDELWKRVQSCTDFSLDHALKYGLITNEEYERLHGSDTKPRMWNYYLPLRGFKEGVAEDEYSYAGLTGRDGYAPGDDVVMKANGRWTEADNPIANILNIAQREIAQGNDNYARQALYNFAVRAGKNSLLSVRKPWYEKVGDKWRLAVPSDDQTIEQFEKEMKEKAERGEARQGRAGAKNTPENKLKLDMMMASKANANQHLIRLKVGGEDRMVWVNGNPAMARAVTGYGRKPGWELTRAASRVISNMFTTYSLDFTAKNLIRDSIYSRVALLMKEPLDYRWKYFKNWWNNAGYGAFAFPMIRLASMWESGELQRKPFKTEKEQMFIDFMHDGGQTGYSVMNSVKQIKRDLDVELGGAKRRWNKMVSATEIPIVKYYAMGVRTLNEAFELLTRFTAYQTSRDMGRSGQRAAEDAKEISVNFNRRGAQSGEGVFGNVAAYLGATHYFYNAGVQGFDNFLRLFKANPKRMTAAAVGLMGLGILTPLLNSMFAGAGDGDDDWYWNLPEWVRRNNIIIGWNDKKGSSYIALPLPVEFRALYGIGDLAASTFCYNKYPNPTAGRVMSDLVSTAAGVLPVNPIEDISGSKNAADVALRAVVPDVTMFFVDWATNHDYTGRPLVKESQFTPNMPKSQAYYASTPLALVKACQAVGTVTGWDIAPGVARDFLNNYMGGFYKVAEDISKEMFTDDEHPRRWDDIPFLSGFTGHIDEDRTDTYVKNVLNAYRDLSEDLVKKVNIRLNTKDVTDDMVYENPEQVLGMAKNSLQRFFVEGLLTGDRYDMAKIYYEGTQTRGTGEYERVTRTYKTGKRAGKKYSRKEEIKIPGTESLRKEWNKLRKEWLAMPDGTPEERSAKAQKKAEVENAWHVYYDASASLAEELMNQEYDK